MYGQSILPCIISISACPAKPCTAIGKSNGNNINPDFIEQHLSPATYAFFGVTFRAMDYLGFCQTVERELLDRVLPSLPNNWSHVRQNLIDKLVLRKLEIIQSPDSAGQSFFNLNAHATYKHDRIFTTTTTTSEEDEEEEEEEEEEDDEVLDGDDYMVYDVSNQVWFFERSSTSNDNNLGMVPATDEAIQSLLERRTIMDSSDRLNSWSCSICLEELRAGCVAATMPCSHAFHGDCIETWLKKSHFCPLCRHDMPTTTS